MSLTEDLTADDLAMFDRPTFRPGDKVLLGVNQVTKTPKVLPKTGMKYNLLNFETKVLNGTNEGKVYNLFMPSFRKKSFVQLLSTMFSKDQIGAGVNEIDAVGKKFVAVYGGTNEVNGKHYDNWAEFHSADVDLNQVPNTTVIQNTVVDTTAVDNIPF